MTIKGGAVVTYLSLHGAGCVVKQRGGGRDDLIARAAGNVLAAIPSWNLDTEPIAPKMCGFYVARLGKGVEQCSVGYAQ